MTGGGPRTQSVRDLTSFAVDLLGSPVEIHLAGEQVLVKLTGGEGRSGDMLTENRRSGRTLPSDRSEAAATAAAAAPADGGEDDSDGEP